MTTMMTKICTIKKLFSNADCDVVYVNYVSTQIQLFPLAIINVCMNYFTTDESRLRKELRLTSASLNIIINITYRLDLHYWYLYLTMYDWKLYNSTKESTVRSWHLFLTETTYLLVFVCTSINEPFSVTANNN